VWKKLSALINRAKEDLYLRNSVILLVFTVVTSVGQYFFQIYANRNLSKEAYGLLNTFLSFTMIVGFLATVLKNWSTKVFSEIYSHKAYSQISATYIYFFKIVGIIIAVFLAGSLLFQRRILGIYQTEDFHSYWLTLGVIVFTYLQVPFFSFLESFYNFLERSVAIFANMFIKLVLTAIFIFAGLRLYKAMIATVAGAVLGFLFFALFAYLKYKKLDTTKEEQPDKEQSLSVTPSYFFKIGFGTFFLTILMNIDMQVARANLIPELSGDFATASVLGKTVFWIGNITIPLFYVAINNAFNKQTSYMKPFLKGMGIVSLLTFGSLLGFFIIIRPFVNLFNPEYLNATDAMKWYAVSVVPYVFINYIGTFFISVNRYRVFIVGTVFALIYTAILYFFGSCVMSLIRIRLYAGIAILLFLLIDFFINRNRFYDTVSPDTSSIE